MICDVLLRYSFGATTITVAEIFQTCIANSVKLFDLVWHLCGSS